MSRRAKSNPDEVPERAVLPGEADPYGWVERAVWTDRMLDALRRGGPEGGRWYWLHDKVFVEKTLEAAFARVARNAGRRIIQSVYDWCRRHRHLPVAAHHKALKRRIQGHFNYFGVSGNF